MEFTLTANPAPTANLTVKVNVAESATGGRFLTDTAQRIVVIPNGKTTAHLFMTTDDDAVDEPDGTVTASIDDDKQRLRGGRSRFGERGGQGQRRVARHARCGRHSSPTA